MFQLCCTLCLCVTVCETDLPSLSHGNKTSVSMHVKVYFEKAVWTYTFSSLDSAIKMLLMIDLCNMELVAESL